jgi:hypothetical protein
MKAWFQPSSLLITSQTHNKHGGVFPSTPYFSMSFKSYKKEYFEMFEGTTHILHLE